MGRKVLLAVVCWLTLSEAIGEAQKKDSSVVDDHSAESAPRLYRTLPSEVYASAAPHASYSYSVIRAPYAAGSRHVPVKTASVIIPNKGLYKNLKDSYGKYVAGPQTVSYKAAFPQQFVPLQDLPPHLAEPLASGSPSFRFTTAPNYFYGPQSYKVPDLHLGPTPTPLTHFGSISEPLVYAEDLKHFAPSSNLHTSFPQVSISSQTTTNKAKFVKAPKYHRPQGKLEIHDAPRKVTKLKAIKHHPKKERIQASPAQTVTTGVRTVVNGKQALVKLETTPPLPLLDLNLLEPLTFDNPLVPQVQHFLPKISSATYHKLDLPWLTPKNKGAKNKQKDILITKTKSYDSRHTEDQPVPPNKKHSKPKPALKPGITVKGHPNSGDYFYEINTPNHKETYNEQVVKYNKETNMMPVEYSYNDQSQKEPEVYSFVHSSKQPLKVTHVEYNSADEKPKHLVYTLSSGEEEDQEDERRPSSQESDDSGESFDESEEEGPAPRPRLKAPKQYKHTHLFSENYEKPKQEYSYSYGSPKQDHSSYQEYDSSPTQDHSEHHSSPKRHHSNHESDHSSPKQHHSNDESDLSSPKQHHSNHESDHSSPKQHHSNYESDHSSPKQHHSSHESDHSSPKQHHSNHETDHNSSKQQHSNHQSDHYESPRQHHSHHISENYDSPKDNHKESYESPKNHHNEHKSYDDTPRQSDNSGSHGESPKQHHNNNEHYSESPSHAPPTQQSNTGYPQSPIPQQSPSLTPPPQQSNTGHPQGPAIPQQLIINGQPYAQYYVPMNFQGPLVPTPFHQGLQVYQTPKPSHHLKAEHRGQQQLIQQQKYQQQPIQQQKYQQQPIQHQYYQQQPIQQQYQQQPIQQQYYQQQPIQQQLIQQKPIQQQFIQSTPQYFSQVRLDAYQPITPSYNQDIRLLPTHAPHAAPLKVDPNQHVQIGPSVHTFNAHPSAAPQKLSSRTGTSSPTPSTVYEQTPYIEEKSKQVIIKEEKETPDEKHVHTEQAMREMVKGEENNEEDFEKAYKESAFGFPAYDKAAAEELEQDIFDPDSYGEPRFQEEYKIEDSPFKQYQQEGDKFPKSARLAYKDARDNNMEDYFLEFAVHKPESYTDRVKNKVNYYKNFKNNGLPKTFYGEDDDKKENKNEKFSTSFLQDFFGTPSSIPKTNLNEHFAQYTAEPIKYEYDYSKEAPKDALSYAAPKDSISFATHPYHKYKRTHFVEPQFQYGFEPISAPIVVESELAASASNNSPESEKPGTRKKIYKENWYIKKTTTGSKPS